MKPERKITLGHVHLKVSDLERATNFYSKILGLKVIEEIPEHFVFLSAGEAHHEIALQLAPPIAKHPGPKALGLYHVAFEVFSPEELMDLLATLKEHGFSSQVVDHGISIAAYLEDPDGNGIEIFIDRRKHPSGTLSWEGQSVRVTDLTSL